MPDVLRVFAVAFKVNMASGRFIAREMVRTFQNS